MNTFFTFSTAEMSLVLHALYRFFVKPWNFHWSLLLWHQILGLLKVPNIYHTAKVVICSRHHILTATLNWYHLRLSDIFPQSSIPDGSIPAVPASTSWLGLPTNMPNLDLLARCCLAFLPSFFLASPLLLPLIKIFNLRALLPYLISVSA